MSSGTRAGGGTDPRLVVVCGPPGVGKSTVAGAVVDRLGGVRLRSDVVRKELFSDPAYTAAETERVYAELFDRAGRLLREGRDAVLDATFRDRELRDRARTLGAERGAAVTVVRVVCDRAVAEARIRAREGDVSDADVAVHRELRESFDPMAGEHATVDNSATAEETLRQVDELF